jgi:hypothetical protein
MVFNATFNNISVISWQSDLLVEETGVTEENHQISLKYVFTQYESLTIEINDRTSHTSSLRLSN